MDRTQRLPLIVVGVMALSGCTLPWEKDASSPAAPSAPYPPPAIPAITLNTPGSSPGTISTPSFNVVLSDGSSFIATDTIQIYNQAFCSGSVVGSATGISSTSSTITVSSQAWGTTIYSARVTDVTGNSSCSSSNATVGLQSSNYILDIARSFFSGVSPVAYSAVVHQPVNLGGAQINVPANSGQTAFQYLNQNIAQAISSQASVVRFPTASYTVTPENGATYHLAISGASDLIIDGQGSTLTFAGVLGGDTQGDVVGIVFSGDQRVVLKNFVIDYDVRIASAGTVGSDSAHCGGSSHQYVLIDTGHYPMADSRIQQAKIFNDSTSNLWGLSENEYYTYSNPVNLQGSNAFYPCDSSFDSAFPTNGHTVTVRHFAYDGNAIGIYGSSSHDITLDGITLYSSPAMGVYVGNAFARGIAIENLKIIKNPNDPTRLITLAADGLHLTDMIGDVVIENSEISFQGDDGLNIVTGMPNSTTVLGNQLTITGTAAGAPESLATGDVFDFYSPNLTFLGTATLQALSEGANIVATFDNLASVSSGDYVIDQSKSVARVYIAGNYFHDNRERGMISRSTGVMVENNTFVNNSGPAILIGTDGQSFMEGAFGKDITIQGNTISSANQTQVSTYTSILEYGTISVGARCLTSSGCANWLSPNSLIQNLLIQNNVISASAGIGMLLSNLNSASVSGNTVVDTASTVVQNAFGGSSSAAGSIHSTRSSGITLDGNTLSRPSTSN
jgi:hypothetical protein